MTPLSLGILNERVENLRKNLDEKHLQNRRDIHMLRNGQQEVLDAVWKIRVKLASWSAASGILTALVVHYIEKSWK